MAPFCLGLLSFKEATQTSRTTSYETDADGGFSNDDDAAWDASQVNNDMQPAYFGVCYK